ncbi:hypothetical protein GQ55_8G226700 [Panicum hallii var. hallii]|uniref:No apical meristem-associated C-terminal domain-containing protein n=1 Tax=Panicum hallii var. hallii TaxID=1504633 RepID=A0A2T7CQ82_9POAL|nr:hypothetical protein GQ55_8G226700 [Panicum hallii var. hallii]
MHNMGVPSQPASPLVNASFPLAPTEDTEVEEVDGTQVSNNKGKKRLAQRGRSFTHEEDRAICSAFLHVSKDPIIGTNQTSAGYYTRMHRHFVDNNGLSTNRTKVSIENRWGTIQKAVNKFCGFYDAMERRNQSGKNEQDRINDAIRMYEEIEPWQFHHCWLILRGEPKWHARMAESNMAQRVNQRPAPKCSETETCSVQAESTLPDRPEGRDSAKKRARTMADTSSSSAAMEMLQKMHDRGEKNDVKEDQLRHEMFKMERERLELQKLNWEKKWDAWEKKWDAWEKKWAVMEANAMTRQNEYELNQWNADLMVMSQDLDKLAPALRAMYQQKQGEIMRRRGISTPPTSDS